MPETKAKNTSSFGNDIGIDRFSGTMGVSMVMIPAFLDLFLLFAHEIMLLHVPLASSSESVKDVAWHAESNLHFDCN